MGVPQEERPTILEKLFHVVQAAVPGGHIFVLIADVTVRLLGSFNDHGNIAHPLRESPIIKIHVNKLCFKTYEIRDIDYHIISTTDTVASESFETYKVKFIPATRSSIEGLQRVRPDSLEEATIKQNLSCSICMNEFAQGGVDQLITHLPCSHRYHVDCIIRWLETSHVCPLCRYPLPSVEDGEPSNS
ncbi:uncharacterized protein LOC133734338 [Rosa rugosa]|uniref:uncharacterized protein LOC133734338 n=1 Tax=Rosa rugosa TaxID=74645 RepID=UPI002B410CB1|nr:uncharacterized protein LOC133734338 [Rosa rugosa]